MSIPVFRFGSEDLKRIHDNRVLEWDGVSLDSRGRKRLAMVYPVGYHFEYMVDHDAFLVHSIACGGDVVPREIAVIQK